MEKIFKFNYKEIIINTISSHIHIKQSRNLIWFIIFTSTNNDKILLLSSQQICSQGVAAKFNFGVTMHLRPPPYQRNSLTTTTTIQHTEGSVCIRRFQNYSFCLYHGRMWHANATCHSLKITLASKVISNMLFVSEIAAILSLFIFLLNYYSSSSRSFSLFTKGKQKGCEKKIKNQEVYVVSHIICKATAADSFKTEVAETITLFPPPQKKWKENFAGQRK